MATNPAATPAHYELAYDEARRALDAIFLVGEVVAWVVGIGDAG
jgi:hypothetical protein